MPRLSALACPACGGSVELRGYAQTLNAVCGHCNAILDARTPQLAILQAAQSKQVIQPLIPLGSRGKLENVEYEVIGFQQRTIDVEGVEYSWSEYLLINPYRGYRYLTEYNGHWNVVKPVAGLPQPVMKFGRSAMRFDGHTHAHFQHATARTTYVLGEFPWQVRSGDEAGVDDYVAPPRILSSESTQDETTWSAGTYIDAAELWRAFSVKGGPPRSSGVYSNQPNPRAGNLLSLWRTYLLLVLLFLPVTALVLGAARKHTAFEQRYSYSTQSRFAPAFVTAPFDLGGRTGIVDVGIKTDLPNTDARFTVSLINEGTGQAIDIDDEVRGSAVLTASDVPPGRYYLRVEPQLETPSFGASSMNYTLRVSHGSASWFPLAMAFLLLLAPPILATIRWVGFESARWRESDYGSMYGTGAGAEDSDE